MQPSWPRAWSGTHVYYAYFIWNELFVPLWSRSCDKQATNRANCSSGLNSLLNSLTCSWNQKNDTLSFDRNHCYSYWHILRQMNYVQHGCVISGLTRDRWNVCSAHICSLILFSILSWNLTKFNFQRFWQKTFLAGCFPEIQSSLLRQTCKLSRTTIRNATIQKYHRVFCW